MPETQWHYIHGGQQQGPVDESTLRKLATQGQVGPADYVWRDGMAGWARAGTLPGLLPTRNPNTPAAAASLHTTGASSSSFPIWIVLVIVFAALLLLGGVIGYVVLGIRTGFQQATSAMQSSMASMAFQSDPQVVLYYGFDQGYGGSGMVMNQASGSLLGPQVIVSPAPAGAPTPPNTSPGTASPATPTPADPAASIASNPALLNGQFPSSAAQHPTWAQGRWQYKSALQFDGKAHPEGDYFYIPHHPYLNMRDGSRTINLWVRQSQTHEGCLISKGEALEQSYELTLIDDVVLLRIGDQKVETSARMGDGNWHMITVVLDRSGNLPVAYLYIDGIVERTMDLDVEPPDTSAEFTLGKRGWSDDGYFNGVIDEMVIFDKVVPDTEIEGWHTMGAP